MEAGYNMISALEVYFYPERFSQCPLASLVPELFRRNQRQSSCASPANTNGSPAQATYTAPPTSQRSAAIAVDSVNGPRFTASTTEDLPRRCRKSRLCPFASATQDVSQRVPVDVCRERTLDEVFNSPTQHSSHSLCHLLAALTDLPEETIMRWIQWRRTGLQPRQPEHRSVPSTANPVNGQAWNNNHTPASPLLQFDIEPCNAAAPSSSTTTFRFPGNPCRFASPPSSPIITSTPVPVTSTPHPGTPSNASVHFSRTQFSPLFPDSQGSRSIHYEGQFIAYPIADSQTSSVPCSLDTESIDMF
ncbi:uncharacterized protein [Ptychodera flava]|uniref:uncharacterized protein n=1 Tax=Ptychodera flava TaxID=63121 RepID=UPI003969FC2B